LDVTDTVGDIGAAAAADDAVATSAAGDIVVLSGWTLYFCKKESGGNFGNGDLK
jgi:hypothetical protein